MHAPAQSCRSSCRSATQWGGRGSQDWATHRTSVSVKNGVLHEYWDWAVSRAVLGCEARDRLRDEVLGGRAPALDEEGAADAGAPGFEDGGKDFCVELEGGAVGEVVEGLCGAKGFYAGVVRGHTPMPATITRLMTLRTLGSWPRGWT